MTDIDKLDNNTSGEIFEIFNQFSQIELMADWENKNIFLENLMDNSNSLPNYSTDDFPPSEIEEILKIYFRFFSKSDIDLIYLHFILKKSQTDLQILFNKTQPAISVNVNRIRQQITLIVQLKEIIDQFLEFITNPNIRLNYRDRDILLVFFYSNSIAKTAQIIGIGITLCRLRIISAISVVRAEGYIELAQFFRNLLKNLNYIKKEVAKDAIEIVSKKKIAPSNHAYQELPLEF